MEEHTQMINDCIDRESRMSDWETNFIDSISNYESITSKQAKVLERIWEKVTRRR